MLYKKFKNNENTSKILAGAVLGPYESYVVEPQFHDIWATDERIESQILGSKLIINNGTEDITSSEKALLYLHNIAEAKNIYFGEGEKSTISVNDYGILEDSEDNNEKKRFKFDNLLGGVNDNHGKFVTFMFYGNGVTANKWLDPFANSFSSYDVPIVLPFDMTLTGLSYSNENQDTDCSIQLYKNNSSITYNWGIESKNYAYKTNGLSSVTYFAGDRVSVYCSGIGVAFPRNVVTLATFKIDNNNKGEGGA